MSLFRKIGKDQIAKIFRPKWRGMAPDVDPQNLREDQPYLSINTRLDGGQPVFRGGQLRRVNLGGKVTGIATHMIGASRSLFIAGDGCPGLSGGAGSYLGVVDRENKPNISAADVYDSSYTAYQNATYYTTATYGIVAATFGDDLLFGLDNVLKRFSAANSLQETRLELPTGYVAISAMIEHEGTLLVACIGSTGSGVGSSAIFKFDGVTLTKELGAINVVQGFGLYRDMAAAIFDGTPNSIRVRTAAGAWGAPVAPSAGTVKIVGSNCTSYIDKLWIPGGDTDLFTYDQAGALTRIPIATNLIDAGGHIMGTEKMEGTLYYVWHNSAGTAVFIGKYNGTTWTPKYKSLTAQATWPAWYFDYLAQQQQTQYPPGTCKGIRQYRGSLVVSGIQAGPGIAALYFSPRNDITATWSRLLMSVSFPNSDISQMTVF